MKRHIGLLLLAALSVVSCNKEGEIFYREGEQKTEEAAVTRALQNASDPQSHGILSDAAGNGGV